MWPELLGISGLLYELVHLSLSLIKGTADLMWARSFSAAQGSGIMVPVAPVKHPCIVGTHAPI